MYIYTCLWVGNSVYKQIENSFFGKKNSFFDFPWYSESELNFAPFGEWDWEKGIECHSWGTDLLPADQRIHGTGFDWVPVNTVLAMWGPLWLWKSLFYMTGAWEWKFTLACCTFQQYKTSRIWIKISKATPLHRPTNQ